MRNQTLDAREVVNDSNFGRGSRWRLKRAHAKDCRSIQARLSDQAERELGDDGEGSGADGDVNHS